MKKTLLGALSASMLCSAALSQNTTLWVDSDLSQWEWTMTAMGANAVPVVDNEFEWSGVQFADLGMNASGNVSSGTFENGIIAWAPDIMGYFPNPIPGAPPLVEFHFEGVVCGVTSLPLNFGDPTTSDGSFQGEFTFEFSAGVVHFILLGTFPYEYDLAGVSGTSQVVFGQFTVLPNGTIHLDSPQFHLLQFVEPSTGITFDFTLMGDIIADSITPQQAFCFGDGSGTTCPCGNFGGTGAGCMNGTGQGAVLGASGSSSVTTQDLVLEGSQLIPNQPGLYFQGDNAVNGGAGVTFGDGLRCAGGNVVRLQVRMADGGGASSTTVGIAEQGGVTVGGTKRYQLWYRDPQTSMCNTTFNLTNGMEIIWLP
ncbi:MAG: hypothetical protein QF903_07600 [Planctomycetota bacterium]|jgi:hypothetical protein|nr:hypothetical protein [Planctomycetota bacterium]MDP6761925.1 hypothetical protein [Planctomycetota bacterium]MDP6989330.1 hypothetical protein [Planctomycetota bacterium]